jgi:septal ring factor EnvC (AmiA/AmiB activator)
MYWLCSKQNCLLCAYECDFGDNDIITIVYTGLTKKNVAVLSVLNIVSDFVKCNHPISQIVKVVKSRKKLFKSCQKVVKSCQKDVKKLSKSCQKLQKVIKKLEKILKRSEEEEEEEGDL